MRLRRDRSDDVEPAPPTEPAPPAETAQFDMNSIGLEPEPEVQTPPLTGTPQAADINSVGVAILPGVPLPPWAAPAQPVVGESAMEAGIVSLPPETPPAAPAWDGIAPPVAGAPTVPPAAPAATVAPTAPTVAPAPPAPAAAPSPVPVPTVAPMAPPAGPALPPPVAAAPSGSPVSASPPPATPPVTTPAAMAPPSGPAFPPPPAGVVPDPGARELPPPDPATWSQHPLGPVVWGTEPPPAATPQSTDVGAVPPSEQEAPVAAAPPEAPAAAAPPSGTVAAPALAAPVAGTAIAPPPAGPPVTPPATPATPSYISAPPPTGPAYPAEDTAPESGDGSGEEGRRNSSLRMILIIGAILIAAALLAFAAFVTPGFLSSAQATDEAPAVVAPPAAAGLTKANEVASAPASMFRDMAAATSATEGAQYATYTGDAVSATVFVSPTFGGSPQSMAQAYESAGGSVGSLTTVAAGPRGGTMACGAVNKKQSVCFWTADGVRGAADVAGMTPEQAGALVGKMRVALEPAPPA